MSLVLLFMVFCKAQVFCAMSYFTPWIDSLVSQTKGREKYLASYGWEIDPDSEEERNVLLPKSFEGAVGEYADMQTRQGYDFASYAGLECRQYTYTVTNYEGCGGTVYATLYIKGTRVIGGDIHSADIGGFMHGIR